jgi:tRNA G10  N-methylase Trm11
VRLGSELFERAVHVLDRRERLTVWDPCCGSGQLVTTISLLHQEQVAEIIATDIDPAALALAEKNLALLTKHGLTAMRAEIAKLSDRFGKDSHTLALAAADRLQARVRSSDPIEVHVRRADIFDVSTLAQAVEGASIDLVITDLPYGRQTYLQGSAQDVVEVDAMLANLSSVLPHHAVIVLVLAGRHLPSSKRRAQAKIRAGGRIAGIYRAAKD